MRNLIEDTMFEFDDKYDRFRDEGNWSEIDDASAFFSQKYTQRDPLPDEMSIDQYLVDCLYELGYNVDEYDENEVECTDYNIIDVTNTDMGYYTIEVDASYNIHVDPRLQYDRETLLKELNEFLPSHFDNVFYDASIGDLETVNINWTNSYINDHDINLDLQAIIYTQY